MSAAEATAIRTHQVAQPVDHLEEEADERHAIRRSLAELVADER